MGPLLSGQLGRLKPGFPGGTPTVACPHIGQSSIPTAALLPPITTLLPSRKGVSQVTGRGAFRAHSQPVGILAPLCPASTTHRPPPPAHHHTEWLSVASPNYCHPPILQPPDPPSPLMTNSPQPDSHAATSQITPTAWPSAAVAVAEATSIAPLSFLSHHLEFLPSVPSMSSAGSGSRNTVLLCQEGRSQGTPGRTLQVGTGSGVHQGQRFHLCVLGSWLGAWQHTAAQPVLGESANMCQSSWRTGCPDTRPRDAGNPCANQPSCCCCDLRLQRTNRQKSHPPSSRRG